MLSFYDVRKQSTQESKDFESIVFNDHIPMNKKLPLMRKSRKHFGINSKKLSSISPAKSVDEINNNDISKPSRIMKFRNFTTPSRRRSRSNASEEESDFQNNSSLKKSNTTNLNQIKSRFIVFSQNLSEVSDISQSEAKDIDEEVNLSQKLINYLNEEEEYSDESVSV
mmetsp:Transcript_7120/g.6314  ORF Transcript_7120/g.6314 Transcript_7120/m.6314 type:complete len:168 (+) Transcript_7120:179-682(+)